MSRRVGPKNLVQYSRYINWYINCNDLFFVNLNKLFYLVDCLSGFFVIKHILCSTDFYQDTS